MESLLSKLNTSQYVIYCLAEWTAAKKEASFELKIILSELSIFLRMLGFSIDGFLVDVPYVLYYDIFVIVSLISWYSKSSIFTAQ